MSSEKVRAAATAATVLVPTSHVAGFDFQFGSLDDMKTPLAKQYDDLLWA